MKRLLAIALLAFSGCGDEEEAPRLAAPPTASNAAELACADYDTYFLESAPLSGDAAADTRTLFDDELRPNDLVQTVNPGTVRIVRGGQVVAVVRFRNGAISAVDSCIAFSG